MTSIVVNSDRENAGRLGILLLKYSFYTYIFDKKMTTGKVIIG